MKHVYYHFLYQIRNSILCPAFGSVAMCELGITAGWVGMVIGTVLIGLLLLKSTEKLKHNWALKRLEHLICAVQVPIQLWLCLYFSEISFEAGSDEDVRVSLFITYFGINAFNFAINGILSYLEMITKERFCQ